MTEDMGSRERRVRRVLLLEGAANFSVLVAKTVVGFSTGSLALIGDAVHSFTDLANNGLPPSASRSSSTRASTKPSRQRNATNSPSFSAARSVSG